MASKVSSQTDQTLTLTTSNVQVHTKSLTIEHEQRGRDLVQYPLSRGLEMTLYGLYAHHTIAVLGYFQLCQQQQQQVLS